MSDKPVSTRRRFFGSAGVALSAPLVLATAYGSPTGADEAARARLSKLEDENAIRELNRTFAALVNARAYGEARALFADPSAARIDPSIGHVAARRFGDRDWIEVGAGGAAATARFHCNVVVETVIGPDCTLAQMAREQGEGVLRRAEPRVLDAAFVKADGRWRIVRADFGAA
jgi:hypothetical protein